MKNNKVLSTLLMMTAMTSMVAGALSVNKNVYRKTDAAVSYKIIYLYVPNDVTYDDGSNAITWDSNNDLYVYEISNDGEELPMGRVQEHLYACLINNGTSADFNFVARVGGELKYAVYTNGKYFRYNDFSTYNTATLKKYNVGGRTTAAEWNINTAISNAQTFANVFTAAFHSACKNAGNSDFNKLNYVWDMMATAYISLSPSDQADLRKSESASLQDFADLYDTIYKKYGNYVDFGDDFAGRNIVPDPAPASKYVTSSVFENETSKSIIVVSSISLVSLSIIGIYFYIRKRKEDK